ncbi:MAG: acyl-CoA dehydrogenase family protein, partial [Pseudomonadota bacterium]
MPLVLNEEQEMLRDSAAGFLAEKASLAELRQLRDAGEAQAYDSAVWRDVIDMGWASIAIPESYGGLGYGYTGLGVVLEQVGRNLSATPLEATVLVGATALLNLGTDEQKAAWLPELASGAKQVTLALQDSSSFDPLGTSMSAASEGDGFRLSGEKRMVLDALTADAFVVVARTAESAGETAGLSAFLVDAKAAGVSVSRCEMVDSRQCGAVSFDSVM